MRGSSFRIAGWLAVAGLVGAAMLVPAVAQATKPDPDHKVTICHRTNSDTNPYVEETVDIASSGHLKGGHDTEHQGPIWDPALKPRHIEWGDIIPPYTYQAFSYPGQNWNDLGQAILAAGCTMPTPTPTTPPTEPPTEPPTATPTGSVEAETGTPTTAPSGSVLAETGTPAITMPPTDVVGLAGTASGDAWRVLLLALAAMVATALVVVPTSRRSRR